MRSILFTTQYRRTDVKSFCPLLPNNNLNNTIKFDLKTNITKTNLKSLASFSHQLRTFETDKDTKIPLIKPLPSSIHPNVPTPKSFVDPYIRLMRLDRPIGTWLLLLPCYWSMALATPAGTFPDPVLMGLFAVGALVMRGAGCTVNDLADRDFDKKVLRTKTRPLASGDLTVKQAVAFLGVQLSAGLAVLLCLNPYTIVLGASSLLLVGTYPFMKRITYWPQAFLGLTFNWGALVGYSAVAGHCDWSIVLPLYLSGVAWTLVYDTIYAHQDKDDDLLIGVKSTALRFGDLSRAWLSFFAAVTVGGLLTSGYMAGLALPFYIGTGVASGHLAWQLKTVDFNDREACMKKFVANKWFGLIVLLSIFAGKYFSDTDQEEDKE